MGSVQKIYLNKIIFTCVGGVSSLYNGRGNTEVLHEGTLCFVITFEEKKLQLCVMLCFMY